MQKTAYIFFTCILYISLGFSQVRESIPRFELKGSVKGKENYAPISGVEVSTANGAYTVTNGLGEFKIKVSLGDELIIESPEFETVRYTVQSNEDVDVLVEGYAVGGSKSKKEKISKRTISLHQTYLDSAELYMKNDIEKSIDFITKSIEQLGKRGNRAQLAISLSTLGELYLYHKQYDLAIANFKDAMEAQKLTKTALLLGRAYLLNKDLKNAEATF
ncbi:MAG: sensor histidine kinase, partial [Bacteroidota bacterium]